MRPHPDRTREPSDVARCFETMSPKLRPAVTRFLSAFYENPHPHEDDFNYFRKLPSDRLAYVDVGANVGLSALSMMKCAPEAIGFGFEANPALEPALALAARHCRDYRYRLIGLSDTASEGTLIVPLVDGYAEYGEASLSPENFERPHVIERLRSYASSGEVAFATTPVSFDRLDRQAEALAVLTSRPFRLVKIDVEGHELPVLEGGLGFIAEAGPMILIEEGHRPEIVTLLAEAGYAPYRIGSDLAVRPLGDDPPLNTLFLNRANREQLRSAAGEAFAA